MKNTFSKIDESDPNLVTVELYLLDGEPRGNVWGPIVLSGNSLSMKMSPQDGSLSAQDAVGNGISLANELNVKMVVVDEYGLWQKEWGELIS